MKRTVLFSLVVVFGLLLAFGGGTGIREAGGAPAPSPGSADEDPRVQSLLLQFQTIPARGGKPLGFRYCSSGCDDEDDFIGDNPQYAGGRHYQSAIRVQAADGTPYFYLTRSGNPGPGGSGDHHPGELLIVRMGSKGQTWGPLGTNKGSDGVPHEDDYTVVSKHFTPAELPCDTVTGYTQSAWKHPGDGQLVGDLLFLPVEKTCEGWEPGDEGGKCTKVDLDGDTDKDADERLVGAIQIFDVGNPENPKCLREINQYDFWPKIDFPLIGVLAVTKVPKPDGSYTYLFFAMGGDYSETKTAQVLESQMLDEDGVPVILDSYGWWSASNLRPDHNDDWWHDNVGGEGSLDYQGMDFVRDVDGRLYLIGTDNDTAASGGEDRVRLFEVERSGEPGGLTITFRADRHLILAGRGDFDAVGGVYVTPEGQLVLYSGEHDNKGPDPSGCSNGGGRCATVRMGEYSPAVDIWAPKFDFLAVGVPHEEGDFWKSSGEFQVGVANVLYRTAKGFSAHGDQEWYQGRGIAGTAEYGDMWGSAVAAGDFDGDGHPDLAVGAPLEDVEAAGSDQNNAGVVGVLYGSGVGLAPTGFQLWNRPEQATANGIEKDDYFGAGLAVGNFDGDQYDDLAVAIPKEDIAGEDNAGFVNVLYGSSSGLTAISNQLWYQSASDIGIPQGNSLDGELEEHDKFGAFDADEGDSCGGLVEGRHDYKSALAAGDFDGDGIDDLAIGVPHEDASTDDPTDLKGGTHDVGIVNIVYGSPDGLKKPTWDRNDVWHPAEFDGSNVNANDHFGAALAAGDFDGDGIDDLAIGAPHADDPEDSDHNTGVVYLLHGRYKADMQPAAYDILHQGVLAGETHPEDQDCFGYALAAGDFNGVDPDGKSRDDLAIGVPGEDLAGDDNVGHVDVVYGGLYGLGTSGAPKGSHGLWQGNRSGGREAGDEFGKALAAGDLNADGIDDLAVGAPMEDGEDARETVGVGTVNVYWGRGDPPIGLPDSPDEAVYQGLYGVEGQAHLHDGFGYALAIGEANRPPTADAGGPYPTPEGTNLTLDASGSSDPGGDPLTYEWDLDDDGEFDDATGPTPTFDMVGQDGGFQVAVRVTDPYGAFDDAEAMVTVTNVAPSVTLESDAPKNEGSDVTVTGTVTDPGWLDTLTATIDWDVDVSGGEEPISGVPENDRPDATLTFSALHSYPDNDTFTARVCGSDDDTQKCKTIDLQILNVPPTADAGSDQTVHEGDLVTLSGSFTDPGSADTHTFLWHLDTSTNGQSVADATTQQLTFTPNDNGVYTFSFAVTDDDGDDHSDDVVVTAENVAPTVSLESDAPKDEGSEVTVSGTVSDPGWLDLLTADIYWGDGTPPEPVGGVLENVQPDATLTFSISHVYGDNGVFTAEVCASDGDTPTCETIDLQIDNVDPTAEINLSGAIVINGVPTFLAHAGDPLDFSGRSTDPGSDDLHLSWDWDDGSAVVTTTYLVNPPHPDPSPSPSIQPRDVTDPQSHAYANACLYEVKFWAEDDDGGTSPVDTANVIMVANAGEVRGAGYWLHQYRGTGRSHFDEATLNCYLAIAGYMSQVFDEEADASTMEKAADVLLVKQNRGSMEEIFDRQLLAAWLNFANGSTELDEMVDTDGDGIADTAFWDAVMAAEAVRLNPNATRAELEEQKHILEAINPGDE